MASNSRFTGLAVWWYKTFLEHFFWNAIGSKRLEKKA